MRKKTFIMIKVFISLFLNRWCIKIPPNSWKKMVRNEWTNPADKIVVWQVKKKHVYKEYGNKSRNLHSLQEHHAFCRSDGIRLTPSLPSAKADIMATSNSSLPVFPRLEPLKNSLVPCSRYGETKIRGREGRGITGTFKKQAIHGFWTEKSHAGTQHSLSKKGYRFSRP